MVYFIVGMILLFIAVIINIAVIIGDYEDSENIGAIVVSSLLIVLAVIAFSFNIAHPSAMDVYESKTELQYTIRGEEVVDSVVVYKNNVK